jgi:hypothetical protein
VATAVRSTGFSRSAAAPMASPAPVGASGPRASRRQRLTSTTALRAATASTSTSPTSEPRDRVPPVARTAARPPTRAAGRVRKTAPASRQLPKAACRSSRTSTAAMAAMPSARRAAASRSGSACTWSWRSRWPQMATFATPDTPISRGRTVQRASTESSIKDSSLDDSPTIMTRLVDDSGWSIWGGLDTRGRACAWVRRSCTTCRARSRSVPGSKISSTRDSPGRDSDRVVSSQATPLSRSCSRGTVMSCSTSAADSPSASVWISTVGGENSGSTSTGRSRSCVAPRTSRATASTSTTDASGPQAPPYDPSDHRRRPPCAVPADIACRLPRARRCSSGSRAGTRLPARGTVARSMTGNGLAGRRATFIARRRHT